jgi:hypothetical protein
MMRFFAGTESECQELQDAENAARGYPSQGVRNTAGDAAWTLYRSRIEYHPDRPGQRVYRIPDDACEQVAPPGLKQRVHNAPELPDQVPEVLLGAMSKRVQS